MFRIIVLLAWLLLSLPGTAATVRITTGEYPPFCSATLPHQGFTSHLIREAFARSGYEVEFIFLPWKRAMLEARSGRYDATSWWTFSDERARDFLFSDPIQTNTIQFFYLKTRLQQFDWQRLEDLDGYRIGITRGYLYSEEFQSYLQNRSQPAIAVNSDEQNFRRLIRERIDLFPVNVVVGLELLRTRFAPGMIHLVDYHPRSLRNSDGFLLFPRRGIQADQLRRDFNRGLTALREDGSLERMNDDLLTGKYSR